MDEILILVAATRGYWFKVAKRGKLLTAEVREKRKGERKAGCLKYAKEERVSAYASLEAGRLERTSERSEG